MGSAKAVVLVGGPSRGTRMRPLTLDIPKPLLPIAGRAVVWHAVQALSRVEDMQEVLLIGFYDDSVFAPFIKDASRDFPNLTIRYMREYQALGTAGGLYHFRDTILRGSPDQIFVLHSDIVCSYPLDEIRAMHDRHRGVGTMLGVKVSREIATRFGCVVIDPETSQARHYVEKPDEFISDTINGGIYLFDKSIFDEIKDAMDVRQDKLSRDPLASQDEQLRLEQDVIAPLAASKKLFVYLAQTPWSQLKRAGSALPSNALILDMYKTTNPMLLRRRSPTIIAKSRADYSRKKGPDIVEPCFIDETAEVDPSAKLGPNVSVGPGVKIGYGCRVKDAIILDNTVMEQSSVAIHAIVGEDCKLGAWARVEGSPFRDEAEDSQDVCIIAKDVTVLPEVNVRSCIVLPHKTLSRDSKNKVLL